MQSSYIIIMVLLFLIIYTTNRDNSMIISKIIRKRKKETIIKMREFASKFIGKECIIYTFNSQLNGTIKEVSDGAILLETNNTLDAVNIDFVVRIREYPRKKNGKKKSVVID